MGNFADLKLEEGGCGKTIQAWKRVATVLGRRGGAQCALLDLAGWMLTGSRLEGLMLRGMDEDVTSQT